MSIISWIILGLIAGFIGSKIVNAEGQGFWLNIALGIIGALVGGYLFAFFGATGVTGLNICRRNVGAGRSGILYSAAPAIQPDARCACEGKYTSIVHHA